MITSSKQGRDPPGLRLRHAAIDEDREMAPHYNVARTLTQTDPEGKVEREV